MQREPGSASIVDRHTSLPMTNSSSPSAGSRCAAACPEMSRCTRVIAQRRSVASGLFLSRVCQ